jgi:hypothetical protein
MLQKKSVRSAKVVAKDIPKVGRSVIAISNHLQQFIGTSSQHINIDAHIALN